MSDAEGILFFTLFDDAMISMTYARTLAETGVFNWFSGAETVQGFTNLIWALYMALIHAIGFSGSLASLVVTLTSAGIIVAISFQVRRLVLLALGSHHQGIRVADFATGSTYFLYPLVFWSLRGFEVGILSLLVLILVNQVVKILPNSPHSQMGSYAKIALVIFLGVGVRIDFVVPVSGVLAVVFLHVLMRKKLTWLLSVVGASLALSVAAVFTFQYFVWGDFLPNTYYLKLDGFSFGERITRGFVASLKLVPIIGIAGFVWWTLRGQSKGTARSRDALILSDYLLAITFVLFVYQIYVGGDAWEGLRFASRYFSVALPLVLVLATISSEPSWGKVSTIPLRYFFLAFPASILAGFGVNPITFSIIPSLVLFLGFGSMAAVFTIGNRFQGQYSNSIRVALFSVGALALAISFYLPSPERVLALVGATAVFICFFITVLKLTSKHGQGPDQKSVALIAALLIAGSLYPFADFWLNKSPQYSAIDATMSRFGLEINEFTSEDATIAVLWAGAPVYYSDRSAIDLLGKSDKHIASIETPLIPSGFSNSDFYPGHNKYNFEYSVGGLRPDVVAQHFGYPGEIASLAKWGYSRFCTRGGEQIYVRNDSRKVNRLLLVDCQK
jgi:hypothetical protein